MTSLVKELEERPREPELAITSMPQLNRKIWGLRRGRLTIMAARTSHGKSALSLQVAKDLALSGKRVLYLSHEMTVEEMSERLFCSMEEVDNQVLLEGGFKTVAHKYAAWCGKIQNTNLVLSDQVGKTWKEIDDLLEDMNPRPDVVFLDYIQAIKGAGTMDVGVLDEYIKNFRTMAKRYNYAGVLVSQINRSGQTVKGDKSPEIHQLKGTGFLEEHADVIVLLFWPHLVDSSKPAAEYWVHVAKNRSGRTGHIRLSYEGKYYLFKDRSVDEPANPEDISKEAQRMAELFDGKVLKDEYED